jgi:Tfp pilus assembly protein PilO
VDLLLIVYLLLPGTSQSVKSAQEHSLEEQANTLAREVAPLQGIEGKLGQTRIDVKKLYAQNIPSQYSELSQHLEKLMKETGVTSPGIHYIQDTNAKRDNKEDLPDVQRIGIDTTVTGEYSKVARFINAMEQDKFLFIIDQVSLNTIENSGAVSLQIKCETFLKET